jgi:hypothetical protein
VLLVIQCSCGFRLHPEIAHLHSIKHRGAGPQLLVRSAAPGELSDLRGRRLQHPRSNAALTISVDLIRCGLRAHEAGRRDADPQTEPMMMMMMMMSASLGRGGGGQAQRATGSSPTAPRFNNCVEGAALTLFAVVYARTRLGGAMPTRRPNR